MTKLFQAKRARCDLSHAELGAHKYYEESGRRIPAKEPIKALLNEMQEYADECEETERIRYLLLRFAKIIFPEDKFNLDGCHTIRHYLQKNLINQLPIKLKDQVCAVTHYLIHCPSFSQSFKEPFNVSPLFIDVIRKDLDLETSEDCTFVHVRWAIILYLFHSSLNKIELDRILSAMKTGFLPFKDLNIPIAQIWEITKNNHSDNCLSTLSAAFKKFDLLNSSPSSQEWRSLSDRLFLIEDPCIKSINITNFQVTFEGSSFNFPFTGNTSDFATFEKQKRLHYLSEGALIPINTFTELGTYLGDSSTEFKQKAAHLVACHNSAPFTADWYYKHNALILTA